MAGATGEPPEGSGADLSPLFAFSRPDARTFFDFQLAAVHFCADRLQANRDAVLALDTGLGKTIVLRAVAERLNKTCVAVFVPGGLVRQVGESLRRYPWESTAAPVAAVHLAETGKQLRAAAGKKGFLVVNRALQLTAEAATFLGDCDLLVFDESHQAQTMRVHKHTSGHAPGVPSLFLSASASEGEELVNYFNGVAGAHSRRKAAPSLTVNKFAEANFVIKKTSRVLRLLGVARPELAFLEVPLNTEQAAYEDSLLRLIAYDYRNLDLRVHVVLAVIELFPAAAVRGRRVLLGLLNDMAHFKDVLPRDGKADERARALLGVEFPSNLRLGAGGGQRVRYRCACCNLTTAEYNYLNDIHLMAMPSPKPFWAEEKRNDVEAATLLIRFPSSKWITTTLKAFPVPADTVAFVLTSDKSAAARAIAVKRFKSHDGYRAALKSLRQAAHCSRATAIGRVFAPMSGLAQYVVSKVGSFLARRRLLLCDSTVDVGFDLHKHLEGIITTQVPRSKVDLQQLIGRVSRICTDVEDQGPIRVVSHSTTGTLENILFKNHLQLEMEGESWGPPARPAEEAESLDARLRARLIGFPELLQRFELLRSGSLPCRHAIPP